MTIANIVFSLVVSKVFSNSFDIIIITGHFGNFALIEAMLFLLYGSAIDITGTAKWSSAMKILGLQRKDWVEGDSRRAEKRALVYFFCAGLFLLEVIILTILLV